MCLFAILYCNGDDSMRLLLAIMLKNLPRYTQSNKQDCPPLIMATANGQTNPWTRNKSAAKTVVNNALNNTSVDQIVINSNNTNKDNKTKDINKINIKDNINNGLNINTKINCNLDTNCVNNCSPIIDNNISGGSSGCSPSATSASPVATAAPVVVASPVATQNGDQNPWHRKNCTAAAAVTSATAKLVANNSTSNSDINDWPTLGEVHKTEVSFEFFI